MFNFLCFPLTLHKDYKPIKQNIMEQITIMTNEQLTTFAEAIAEKVAGNGTAKPETESGKRYVYGIRGIRELFNVSHVTAQRYKQTWLQPAVTQRGRKIITDVDKAMELFNNKQ